MRAALEEYNHHQKIVGFDHPSNTVPSMKSPDKQDGRSTGIDGRRRGATIIGTRDYLQPILTVAGEKESDIPISSSLAKDDGYNNIKLRYLRSLNISIATPTKDVQVSASAPIPIPIPLRHQDDDSDISSDEEDDRRNNNQIDDDDDINNNTTTATHFNPYLHSNTNNFNNFDNNTTNNDFMIGTPEISHMPVRKDSKSKAKPKFIPPHELLGNTNGEASLVNHSLPGNHRRKYSLQRFNSGQLLYTGA
ncbi:hypothetical protein PPL_07821 [Heterostelium album PN500]|uniref:Uncharacterized protein n=1 Tax=Heterostelium pallidum (strain ATCC 26659 / Pp 5 / PN500) TaxID=670386 RepID=D3BH19_HETP5|nr:hypothetical protein PPL_07821 [Heterostelium album PN500]EFA79403.1 hypothetical protein PPL_07821 [Heterostelium album PN500]|eukprot:XP_020431524.1 hypothetical protein PPL_07821 [Heterostelium album PN500]